MAKKTTANPIQEKIERITKELQELGGFDNKILETTIASRSERVKELLARSNYVFERATLEKFVSDFETSFLAPLKEYVGLAYIVNNFKDNVVLKDDMSDEDKAVVLDHQLMITKQMKDAEVAIERMDNHYVSFYLDIKNFIKSL